MQRQDNFYGIGKPEPASGKKQRRRQIHRILDRDGVEFQSKGIFHVVQTRRTCAIFLLDFFHTVIHLPFPGLFAVTLTVYYACFAFFALFWIWFSDICHIGLDTYRDAFYLSVETQMTIGYGVKEPDTDIHNGIIFLGLPAMVSHKIDYNSPLAPDVPSGTSGCPSQAEVRNYLSQSPYLEVLVLLSGTEESTGAVVEARHSYTLEDIFWNRTYGTCVSINSEGYHCVDFHAIHHTYALTQLSDPVYGVNSLAHGVSHTFPAFVHDNALDSEDE